MATTTVVTSSLFNKVGEALKQMQQDDRIGELSLAMLVASSAAEDKWTLVLASKALDQLGLRDGTDLILQEKKRLLGEDEAKIDTVRILRTKSPAVRDFGSTFEIYTIGTSYQAHGLLPLYLDLDEPILFVAKAA